MAEFEEKLNAILSDPQAMGQIMSIAKALTGEGDRAAADAPPPPQPEPAEPNVGAGMTDPLSALADMDPRLLQLGMRVLSEFSASDDRKVALLNALKPFVKPERWAKVDKAVQIAKLARVVRVAFQLFRGDGEEVEEDV